MCECDQVRHIYTLHKITQEQGDTYTETACRHSQQPVMRGFGLYCAISYNMGTEVKRKKIKTLFGANNNKNICMTNCVFMNCNTAHNMQTGDIKNYGQM